MTLSHLTVMYAYYSANVVLMCILVGILFLIYRVVKSYVKKSNDLRTKREKDGDGVDLRDRQTVDQEMKDVAEPPKYTPPQSQPVEDKKEVFTTPSTENIRKFSMICGRLSTKPVYSSGGYMKYNSIQLPTMEDIEFIKKFVRELFLGKKIRIQSVTSEDSDDGTSITRNEFGLLPESVFISSGDTEKNVLDYLPEDWLFSVCISGDHRDVMLSTKASMSKSKTIHISIHEDRIVSVRYDPSLPPLYPLPNMEGSGRAVGQLYERYRPQTD